MTHQAPTRIVVVGGGYAGTTAADRLRRRDDVDVVLVNPRPRFVERIRLHQLAAGTHAATADFAPLLGDGVRLVVDTATRIDTAAGEVVLASGTRLPYDHLVYAVGSTGAVPAAVPGAREHAHPIAELEPVQGLRAALDARGADDAPVTVVGGGLAGIETAAELVEAGHAVRLVCGGTLAPALSARARRRIARWLVRHGVELVEAGVVAEVRPDTVVLDDATVLPGGVTVWATGFAAGDLAAASGLRTDAVGRLITDETLASVDDARIVAAGDAAAPSDQPVRMSCQAAGQLGAAAADAVLARLAGTAPAPLDLRFVGSSVSLGRRDAVVQVARPDDTPLDVVAGGRAAAVVKEAICRGTLWGLRREARRPGSTPRIGGGRRVGAAPAAR